MKNFISTKTKTRTHARARFVSSLMSDRMEENSVYKVAHSTGRSLSASLSVQLFGSQKVLNSISE
jgi:hypothetical protein